MNDICNAKQGLQAVVAKQRHMLPNDIIFRKKRVDDGFLEFSLK